MSKLYSSKIYLATIEFMDTAKNMRKFVVIWDLLSNTFK